MSETNPVNIAAWLPIRAQQQPDRMAVAFPSGRDRDGSTRYTQLTYRELETLSNEYARGLMARGLTPGMRSVLMVQPSLEFFGLTFALFKIGVSMVCVDPGMGIKNLKKCLAEAQPQAFIGIPKAHVARLILGWARSSLRINVIVGPKFNLPGMTSLSRIRRIGAAQVDLSFPETSAEQMAAILFTSGSTGIPKGVVYTHANFVAQVEALKHAYQIEPGEVDLATFPLFALYAPALGMSAVIPEMDFTQPGSVDPLKIIEPVQKFGVTNMFGSPALLNRLGRYAETHPTRLSSLKRVISAGAPVPAQVMKRLLKLLPEGVQVFTPYGATESLPVASIGSDEILGDTSALTNQGRGVCVGKPALNITAKIIKITDDAIESWEDDLLAPPHEIGEIVVQGPVVTRAYFNRDASTKLAKIKDPQNNSFYHRMGDLGYFDSQGRLWFCGRKTQRVMTPTGDHYTIPCEGVFNTHEDVFRSALVTVRRQGVSQPALCVELEKDRNVNEAQLLKDLEAMAQSHEHTKMIHDFYIHPSFPVDIRHNAKIERETLSQWAMGRVS